jgi:hypothetical protein
MYTLIELEDENRSAWRQIILRRAEANERDYWEANNYDSDQIVWPDWVKKARVKDFGLGQSPPEADVDIDLLAALLAMRKTDGGNSRGWESLRYWLSTLHDTSASFDLYCQEAKRRGGAFDIANDADADGVLNEKQYLRLVAQVDELADWVAAVVDEKIQGYVYLVQLGCEKACHSLYIENESRDNGELFDENGNQVK